MTLLERVRSVLASEYEIRGEIGRGGMGVVFLARDRALDRRVAIKVIRPEMATAVTVERFLREARALASIEHPNVVRVHRAGDAGGLHYYVMEFVEGETLAARLGRGPLSGSDLERLAADLLGALEAIHGAGIIHRDIKPANIFLSGGRALLGDFGIAASAGEAADGHLTRTGQVLGTPHYLAPEQRHGEATSLTDIHAVALVLYEASTGRPWHDVAGTETQWSGVPRWLRRPLGRALDPDPANRPGDAHSLREALAAARRGQRNWRSAGALGALMAVAVVIVVWAQPNPPDVPPEGIADLAVLPFEVIGSPSDSEAGRHVWRLATLNLSGLEGLKVIPPAQASRFGPLGAGAASRALLREIRAVGIATGTLSRGGDRFVLRVAVEDSLGQPLGEARAGGRVSDPAGTADSVALALVRLVVPHLASSYRRLEALDTESFQALRAFLRGEDAFADNAWARAEGHYRAALAEDSSFTLAKWRLWYIHNWQLAGEEEIDLARLYREHGHELGTFNRALMAARALPPGPMRLDSLERVTRRLGHSAYGWLLLGDEHYHRGPLAGGSLGDAARYLAEAAARDPDLAPAYEHSVLALTRLGREPESRAALDNLLRTAARRAPGERLHIPSFLELAYLERFAPEAAATARDSLLEARDPDQREALVFVARMGLSLDVPRAQVDLGRRLASAPGMSATLRVQGHRAQALALVVLGRPTEALEQFDSAAMVQGTPVSRLEAAEWRVLGPILGIDGIPSEERARGRGWLRDAMNDPELAGRAAWALALDAYDRGDAEGAAVLRGAMEAGDDPESSRLTTLAAAFDALLRDDLERVLTLTDPLLARQYSPDQGYPFTRAALHVVRARAYEGLGRLEPARTERRWADNQDIAYVLDGPVQAVEVDWALSPFSDRARARLAFQLADTVTACRLLSRVRRLWDPPEPALDPLLLADTGLSREACP